MWVTKDTSKMNPAELADYKRKLAALRKKKLERLRENERKLYEDRTTDEEREAIRMSGHGKTFGNGKSKTSFGKSPVTGMSRGDYMSFSQSRQMEYLENVETTLVGILSERGIELGKGGKQLNANKITQIDEALALLIFNLNRSINEEVKWHNHNSLCGIAIALKIGFCSILESGISKLSSVNMGSELIVCVEHDGIMNWDSREIYIKVGKYYEVYEYHGTIVHNGNCGLFSLIELLFFAAEMGCGYAKRVLKCIYPNYEAWLFKFNDAYNRVKMKVSEIEYAEPEFFNPEEDPNKWVPVYDRFPKICSKMISIVRGISEEIQKHKPLRERFTVGELWDGKYYIEGMRFTDEHKKNILEYLRYNRAKQLETYLKSIINGFFKYPYPSDDVYAGYIRCQRRQNNNLGNANAFKTEFFYFKKIYEKYARKGGGFDYLPLDMQYMLYRSIKEARNIREMDQDGRIYFSLVCNKMNVAVSVPARVSAFRIIRKWADDIHAELRRVSGRY